MFNDDPFDNYDPIFGGIEDPFPPIYPDPEPPIIVDDPESPVVFDDPEPHTIIEDSESKKPSISGKLGSNNSGWPCACTGLYI